MGILEAILIGAGIIFFSYAQITDSYALGQPSRREAYCRGVQGCYDNREIGTQRWMDEQDRLDRERKGSGTDLPQD